jgi:hypothetical protein
MSFDQSLTAFALESSGAAARALGVSHTLTLSPHFEAESGLLAVEEAEGAPHRVAVPREGPPPLTLTL